MGAHVEDDGVVFRTFAPSASGVVLLHKGREIPMNCISDGNFYEVKVADAACGDTYEYRIYHHGSQYTDHCDPYGFGMELRPDHQSASIHAMKAGVTRIPVSLPLQADTAPPKTLCI